jgi:Tol biopolymer transport system component
MRRACAVLLLLLLPACSDPTEPGEDGYDEDQDGILFVSNRYGVYDVYDIFRANVDGTGVENLTLTPARHYGGMTLSPDGSRIAFTSDRSGCYNIWVMDVDGTDPVQLTGMAASERCNETPYWSTDGSRIAFISSRQPSEGWQVYVMSADGSDPRKVSVVPGGEPGHGNPLGWSPDGRVVFEHVTDTATTIYTVAPDGTGAEPLFGEAGVGDPVWSPDGERLAFIRTLNGHSHLVVREADGTEETLVVASTSEQGAYMSIPSAARGPWSPDGSRIAFHIAEGWTRQVFVVDADGGTGFRQLTDDPEHPAVFDGWSPDGARIAFTSDVSGTDDVYLVNADGIGLMNLTYSPAEDSDALWLPRR